MHLHEITQILQNSAVLGLFGGVVSYLRKVALNKTHFSALALLLNCIFAFFVGYVVGKFLPQGIDENIRAGISAVSGLLSHNILNFLELHGVNIVIKLLSKKTGTDFETDESKR